MKADLVTGRFKVFLGRDLYMESKRSMRSGEKRERKVTITSPHTGARTLAHNVDFSKIRK